MKKYFISILSISIFFLLSTTANAAFAATLLFDPSSASVGVGETKEIKVNIDATGEQVRAADIYVLYDASMVEVSSVSSGSFFPNVQNNTSTAGKAFIGAGDPSPGSFKSGTGTVATLTIKGKATGTSTISFDCVAGSTAETNIYKNDTNATDVMDCTKDNTVTLTVGSSSSGGTNPTSPPSSGSSSSSSSTSTTPPSELPQTGIADTMNTFAIGGTLLLLLGGAVKLLFLRKY